MSILIAYGTIEGQTGKIARFVKSVAEEAGLKARLLDTSDLRTSVRFDDIDTVVAAASVHERRHPKDFEVFLTAHADEIAARRSIMLSVSLSAAFPEGLEDAEDYLTEMKMRTGFSPDEEVLVAGAIRSHGYDYFAAQVVRHVVLRGRDCNRNLTEHEFTDWDALRERLSKFFARLPASA